MVLVLSPCTVKQAQAWVLKHHRHLPRVTGGLFAVAVEARGQVVGIGLAANPPRVWQGTGRVVISRVATVGEANCCSMIYGALCRAAKALGYKEVWTYTRQDEPGTSLRAAGFEYMGLTKAEQWSRASRPRKSDSPAEHKHRWKRTIT